MELPIRLFTAAEAEGAWFVTRSEGSHIFSKSLVSVLELRVLREYSILKVSGHRVEPAGGGPTASDTSLTTVPEPATWIILALPGVTFCTYRKCRRPYRR
jgi:hypothetical protein